MTIVTYFSFILQCDPPRNSLLLLWVQTLCFLSLGYSVQYGVCYSPDNSSGYLLHQTRTLGSTQPLF